jgi:GMC oxidoreductase
MACFPRNWLCACVPILKFASAGGILLGELQYLKDTSNLIISVWSWVCEFGVGSPGGRVSQRPSARRLRWRRRHSFAARSSVLRSSSGGWLPTQQRPIRNPTSRSSMQAARAFIPSTCAIGPAHNPMAVVDPRCRVYGVEGLQWLMRRSCDAIVSANTNMPTIMISERVAEFIRHGGQ